MKDYYSCRNYFLWIKVDGGYSCFQDSSDCVYSGTLYTDPGNRWTKVMDWGAICGQYDNPIAIKYILSVKYELEKKEFYNDLLGDFND